MSKSASRLSKSKSPTPEEVAAASAAREEEAFSRFAEARALAAEAFDVVQVEPEMVLGSYDLLGSGVAREVALPLVRGAIERGRALSADVSAVFLLVEILLEDEAAQAHLDRALAEARKVFGQGVSAETVLDVYYRVYGEDDEFEAEE